MSHTYDVVLQPGIMNFCKISVWFVAIKLSNCISVILTKFMDKVKTWGKKKNLEKNNSSFRCNEFQKTKTHIPR